jgi:hypothetical protein
MGLQEGYLSASGKECTIPCYLLAGWLAGWLVGWLVGLLVYWLVGLLVSWFNGWLVGVFFSRFVSSNFILLQGGGCVRTCLLALIRIIYIHFAFVRAGVRSINHHPPTHPPTHQPTQMIY